MEDSKKPPIVFANQVIRQLIDHSFGDQLRVTPSDFTVMRLVFRNWGGSWEKFWHGDPAQQGLLKKVIMVWGQVSDRTSEP